MPRAHQEQRLQRVTPPRLIERAGVGLPRAHQEQRLQCGIPPRLIELAGVECRVPIRSRGYNV